MKLRALFVTALAVLAMGCELMTPEPVNPTPGTPEDPENPSVVQGNLPKFTRFYLSKEVNEGLVDDFECPISEGNVIDVVCPRLDSSVGIIPSFEGDFESVTIEGVVQTSGVTAQDFNNEVVYLLSNPAGKTNKYTVRIRTLNGLPRVDIHTDGKQAVTSKETYVAATINFSNTPEYGNLSARGGVKGRGNATWTNYPKKPYKIKFDEKVSLLGKPKNKHWVLLAEYCDKSLMRTAYMSAVSSAVGLPWTISVQHVDLYMNDLYLGTYVLTEHVRKDSDRVDLEDDGFLFENDNYYYQEPLYMTTSKNWKYTFKYPDAEDGEITKGDDNYNFILQYMNDFEKALYSNDFKDEQKGYRKYIDARSFAKWYLVNELTGNLEPNIYYSMVSRNDKVQMNPEWDAEWSLGLAARGDDWAGWELPPAESRVDIEIWKKERYFPRLFEDPYFVGLVKEEWEAFKPKKDDMQAALREKAMSIIHSQSDNFDKWPILESYISVGLICLGNWIDEYEYVATFFDNRCEWFEGYVDNGFKVK